MTLGLSVRSETSTVTTTASGYTKADDVSETSGPNKTIDGLFIIDDEFTYEDYLTVVFGSKQKKTSTLSYI